MASAYNDTVKVFKAFCDENRLRILEIGAFGKPVELPQEGEG